MGHARTCYPICTFEQDYILRLAKQLANLVARLLRLRDDGRVDEALTECDAAYGELFGLPSGLVDAMEASELAKLLGDTQRCDMMAELLETEARLCTARGHGDDAERKRRKAVALREVYFPAQRK